MNNGNIIEYIKSGLGIAPEKKQFRKMASIPLIMTLTMGLIPGIVLGGYQLILSITMIIISLAIIIIVFILSDKGITVKNRLVMQIIIYAGLLIQISLLEALWLSLIYQSIVVLCLLYIPPILIPILLGLKAAKEIKKERYIIAKKFFIVEFEQVLLYPVSQE